MSWTLHEPVADITVNVKPGRGDISVEEDYQTAVHYALNGTTPFVTDGPARAVTPRVPELVFFSHTEVEELRTLRALRRRCILSDDMGNSYPVKFVGGLRIRYADVPHRDTHPLIYVQVAFVGVA